jgi:UDP-N-acetylglucosamine 4,6-dehydratase
MNVDWRKSSVLITGGTGSFGQMFARLLLAENDPRKIIIYSRDEWKQNAMRANGLNDPRMRYFIGDVRDRDRLRRAMRDVDIVVHAAALKQVPACEYNPIEAVATNIDGARNVIDAALDCEVKKVLALSTDKAAAPLNIYGATKLVSEKLFVNANAYSGGPWPRFSCVRYGNVLGSRGSVVPLFKAQRATGRVTVTDERMTRFWITCQRGCEFVLSSVERMHGGEVFIPKLPSMKLLDVARAIAPDCEIDYIGTRAGEKLHELLLSQDEARTARDAGDRYVLLPAHAQWPLHDWCAETTALPDGFEYSSATNDLWMPAAEMLGMISDDE